MNGNWPSLLGRQSIIRSFLSNYEEKMKGENSFRHKETSERARNSSHPTGNNVSKNNCGRLFLYLIHYFFPQESRSRYKRMIATKTFDRYADDPAIGKPIMVARFGLFEAKKTKVV